MGMHRVTFETNLVNNKGHHLALGVRSLLVELLLEVLQDGDGNVVEDKEDFSGRFALGTSEVNPFVDELLWVSENDI